MGATEIELALHRKGTEQFIAKDPTILTLTPTDEVEEFGTKHFVDQPDRPEQVFKVIWPGGDTGGKVATSEGETARYDFILVGKHDAEIEIGDHWVEGDQIYVVESIAPYNGYEVKAGGSSHGTDPEHG
jgi:hypothetical protein